MRHAAWLNAAPRPAKEDDKPITRLQQLRKDQGEQFHPEMPPVTWGHHLLNHLFEVGPTSGTGMGPAPVSWHEIDAWMRRAAVELSPWSVRMLRHLSAAYVSELRAAEEPGRPPPFSGDNTYRKTLARSMRDSIRSLAKK